MNSRPISRPTTPPIPEQAADGRKRTLYVIVRRDLSLAQQMVQAAHAAAEAGRSHYRPEHGIASLIVLAVADKPALHRAAARLDALGIEHELFFEPDWQMGHSALATRPLDDDERKLMRGWPLWRAPEPAACVELEMGAAA